MTNLNLDLSALLPDDATLKARRAALVDAVGASGETTATPVWRRGPSLALAGAVLTVAGAVLVLGLSSGPTAEPAAAEVLRDTAAIAVASEPAEAPPEPGQFLYTKTKTLEYEGWIPGFRTNSGGPIDKPGAFAALVPTNVENWISPDGNRRTRQTLGKLEFLSGAEQSRWEAAGMPLPGQFDPSEQDAASNSLGRITDNGGHLLDVRRGVLDIEYPKQNFGPNFGYVDVSNLPTEPEALRPAVESRLSPGPGTKAVDTEDMIVGLWSILEQPILTPALRAAAFNVLAELPGIELNRDATDLLGRPGYAIGHNDKYGFRGEYVFDPETAEILGRRTVLVDPGKASGFDRIPAGTVIREIAFLQGGVVDSTHETPAQANGGPVATTDPTYRR